MSLRMRYEESYRPMLLALIPNRYPSRQHIAKARSQFTSFVVSDGARLLDGMANFLQQSMRQGDTMRIKSEICALM